MYTVDVQILLKGVLGNTVAKGGPKLQILINESMPSYLFFSYLTDQSGRHQQNASASLDFKKAFN